MFIGIDYGVKRVGVAVSDEENTMAFPLEVVEEKDALMRVRALATERKVDGIVMGESKNFAGEDNPVMDDIRHFADELSAAGLHVIFEPEFMTSAAASHQFTTPEHSRGEKPSKEKLDASAAALILQSFLDRQRSVQ